MSHFYTYAYLREDGTPYYIGKGKGDRATHPHRKVKVPKDLKRILFLKTNLTEEEAFKHEIYMIAVFGRKDKGTGILWNFTDGGEGPSGRIFRHSEETREKFSLTRKGVKKAPFTKEHCENISKGMTGVKKSPEHRENISKAQKGKKRQPLTPEHKAKISETKRSRNKDVTCDSDSA